MARRFLSLIMVLALVLGLASVAQAELDPNEQVTLRFAWWGAQLRHDRTQQIVDMYMEMHPNVKIETEFYDWGSYWDKLAAQGAGGALPDLIQMSTSYTQQYYEGGLLLNLEPYVESGVLDLSDIPPNTLGQGRLGENGDLYAMNLGMNALMGLYDPAIAEAAGIEVTQRYTMDDLYAWGQIVKEKTGVYTSLYTNQPAYMLRSQGSHLFKQDGTGELGFDDPALLSYFSEMHLKGIEEGIALTPEVAAERRDSVDESFFVIGEQWITFTWSNIAAAIINAAGRELATIPYPLVPGKEDVKPLSYAASQQICASSATKHPDWAADFINYMINSVEANQVLLAERGVPVNTKVNEAIQPMLDVAPRMAAEYLNSIDDLTTEVEIPEPGWAGEIIKLIEDYDEQILYKMMTPEEGMAAFIEAANAIIASKK